MGGRSPVTTPSLPLSGFEPDPAPAGDPAGEPQPFDVCGDLPNGVTVLEASAGTGKTFTIASLAARYVAGGTPLHQLLIVTFTRMATGELRDRVRQRLVSAEAGLDWALRGVTAPPEDTVLCLLAKGPDEQVEERRKNLAEALAGFDAATIVTTHGFCQHVLEGLGVAGDVERDATFVEVVDDLVAEVVDDLYVRKFHRPGFPLAFNRKTALEIGKIAVKNFWSPIEPAGATDPDERLRVSLAQRVRAEVDARKRRAALLTYDDLLSRLRDTLANGEAGAAACRRLRERYRVALVDEFQDTDPVQWEIMRRAFGPDERGASDATLVLIGDPKQAIYAFRGADVYAYLDAARSATRQATLSVNWRSDQGLIDAYDTVFSGARFGHEGIAYLPVHAADANQAPRLEGAPCDAPLRLRVVHRTDPALDVRLTQYGFAMASPARELIARDLAADVVALLSSQARIDRRRTDGTPLGREEIRPAHIAVLVRTNRHAALVRDALDAMDVPAVINGAGSVFGAPVAREWLRLLEALERPTSPGRARSAALTPFFGWTAGQVAAAGDPDWENVHARLHRWAGVLRRRGVASLLETMTHSEGLPRRVLTQADGERQLTDLRHIGQLLHAEAAADQLGVTALTTWLRQRVAEAAGDTDNEERSRRLESDAEAVQVLTIHRSKGLEFPVVYFPYLWDPSYIPRDAAPIYHDPANGDRRTIYVGASTGAGYDHHYDLYRAEQRAEDLRLAYVALTRAQHQAVVWWAGSSESRHSPLGRLLFSRGPDGTVAPNGSKVPADDVVAARFEELAALAKGCVSVELAGPGGGLPWAGPAAEATDLAAGIFGRILDPHWRRTSYTAITAGSHEARVSSEPEETVTVDEPELTETIPSFAGAAADGAPADEASLRAVPSLLAGMPGGVDVGTFVHRVLECVDFAATDLDGALAAAVATEAARRHVDIGDPALAVAGLAAAVRTPLGPLMAERSLADFARPDRLDELGFELPLMGGDTPGAADLDVRAIGTLLRRHLSADDPLAGYADRLDAPGLQHTLRGYLSGSLDIVLRLRNGDGAVPRFAVVDHKTNWLGSAGEDLSAWHYRPAALAEAMQRAHYPLQALLYTAALHRYLRWRLADYSPERNLAGVLYLFLRGMTGPDAPRVDGHPCGVFAWRPPAALVEALSDLLDRGAAAA